jgi:hypoxanthine phosphoribosyltransferase
MRIVRLSWQGVEKDCRTLSKKILTDGFRPDICVAISRGGFPPARILCDLLGITNLTSIRIEFYSDVDETLAKPRLVFPLNADVRDKRVLIVDDIADRGDSLMLAKRHVQDNGATEIKVATLHYKPWSKLMPDYYAREYKSWIVYPWEVTETIRKIISNLQQKGRNMSQIRKALFQIGITEPEIRMATKELLY